MKIILESAVTLLTVVLLGAFCPATAAFDLPEAHPEELPKGRPVCTGCHDQADGAIIFKRFDHNLYFTDHHAPEARQSREVCAMCHRESFCSDCHATGIELKPSLKNQADTYRRSPHRGDFLTRHRIEGRIDPTSCFRCHGKPGSAERCARCHG